MSFELFVLWFLLLGFASFKLYDSFRTWKRDNS